MLFDQELSSKIGAVSKMLTIPGFGARAKQAILRRYDSLVAYARETQWDAGTITKMTLHGRVPPLERLLQMREKLGVSVDWLLFGTGVGVVDAQGSEEFPAALQELLWLAQDLSAEAHAALRTMAQVLALPPETHQSWQTMLIQTASAIDGLLMEGLRADRVVPRLKSSS